MKNIKINRSIFLIIKTYILVLSIFSIFRILLFITEIDRINFGETSLLTIIKSFIMGVRFDTVISGYILFIPALVLLVSDFFNFDKTDIKKIIFYWIFIFFTIAFIISSADIPYFNQFFERFSIGAFKWMDNFGFVVSMIIQEPKYSSAIIPFLLLDVLFFTGLKRIFKQKEMFKKNPIVINIIVSILFLGVMFVGIRGRVQKKSPIRVGTAYISNNSFLNKMGLNPVFTFMRSYLDSKSSSNNIVNLMDNDEAVRKVQSYLHINKQLHKNSPIAREIKYDSVTAIRPNVVLIIMESMSAAKMKRYGNKHNLTPFLDSLSHNSIYFENIYTAGKHTFNGVFSTLFSFPALYRQHTMNQIYKYDGISSTLLKKGYSTTYFTTHDGQFDNVAGFLKENKFQNVITQSDYPFSEIKTTLGVPDDYMFRFSIPVINKLSKKNKPFFVTFMTASDHGPFYIPEYFKPKTTKIKQQITEYADWSLKRFLLMAKKQKWFDNTIFVFIADHGAAINASYDIPLNYFHVPLIFYAPKILPPNKTFKKIGSQLDVYPTIMGFLKQPYINNTLGINLLKKDRPYAIVNDDNKIGILDSTFLCIMKDNGNKLELYKYRNKDKIDYFKQNKDKAIDMATFAKANMQVYQRMKLKKETSIRE